MRLSDPIHGNHDVTEPVLIELLNSKPIQRLKHINQYGCTRLITPGATVTRYEHSVGVMLLLRRLKAGVKEQAAGLLHDASHTAFSHMADYLMGNHEQTYHETVFTRVIGDSEIPGILKRHGLDPDRVFDEHRFGLLERNAPDLCADRVDYALRDHSARVRGMDGKRLARHLSVHAGMIVFVDADAAEEFAMEYLRLDREFWASPREAAGMQILAETIRRAMEVGCLDEDDLFLTDEQVLARLRACSDEQVQHSLTLLTPGFSVVESSAEQADMHVAVKCRFVDPPVLIDGKLRRVSKLSERYATQRAQHERWCRTGHHVRISRQDS